MKNRYVVFDVETPNRANDRISAIGIVVVENGKQVQEYYSLVNPEAEFDLFNTNLTGISAETVKDQPIFPVVWNEIKDIMESGLLVAHNAAFDMSVLAKTLNGYGIEWMPYVYYACTCQMARNNLGDIPNARLNTLCNAFGIKLTTHHKASDDAEACAELLVKFMGMGIDPANYLRNYDILAQHSQKEVKVLKAKLSETTHQLLDLKTILQDVSEDGVLTETEVKLLYTWLEQNDNLKGQYPYDKVVSSIEAALEDGLLLPDELADLLALFEKATNPLEHMCGCSNLDVSGKTFCLSGEFEYGSKSDVENYFVGLGGIIHKNITKKTDFLFVGKSGSAAWSSGNYGNKVKKAMELQAKGGAIQIVKEEDIAFCE